MELTLPFFAHEVQPVLDIANIIVVGSGTLLSVRWIASNAPTEGRGDLAGGQRRAVGADARQGEAPLPGLRRLRKPAPRRKVL
jgi:hypothetical protein